MVINNIKQWFSRYFEYLLIPLGISLMIILWHFLSGFYPAYILPKPEQVWLRLQEFLRNGLIAEHLMMTFVEAGTGFILGTLLALPVGYFVAHHPIIERCLTPYIVGVQAIPIVALAPLLVIWFGFGIASKILIAALVTFFPVLTNGVVGFRSVDPRLVEMMKMMGANQKQIFTKLELPAALPVIFGGLKLGITLSVIGAVVGEFAGAGRGLGYLVNAARGSFDTPLIFVALIFLALLGIGFYLAISLMELWLLPWKRKE